MNTLRISAVEQLHVLSQHFCTLTNVDLPVDYLRRGVARAWMSETGDMAAAFACVTEPPFRILTALPDEQWDEYLRESVAAGLVCELNAVFVRPEYRGEVDVVMFARDVFRTFVDTGKRCGLFGYSTQRTDLEALYKRPFLNPVPLHEGTVRLPTGFVTSASAFFGYFRADHIANTFRFTSTDPAPHGRAACVGSPATGAASAYRLPTTMDI